MSMLKRLAYIFTTVISILPPGLSKSHAEEVISNFSLGYGNLTLTENDPKAPAPVILTAKYGFKGSSGFRPYLGTGLAYTLQQETKPGEKTKITAGIAGQAGFSYLLGESSSLNIDYKYFHISPVSKQGDTSPQSIGIGLKIQF